MKHGLLALPQAGANTWANRFALVASACLVALVFLPQLSAQPLPLGGEMALGWALVVGFLTSFHCVSMCGGFVLAWSTRPGAHLVHHGAYALGKTLCYAACGAVCGALGQVLAPTPQLRAWAGLIGGTALILYGAWPLWRTRPQSGHCTGCHGQAQPPPSRGPFRLGLLNGLMVVCGPLQAMYLAAAGTANPLTGALLLALFGLGTLPVLLGFAAASGLLGRRLRLDLARFGALAMCLFGGAMLVRGLALAGVDLAWAGSSSEQPSQRLVMTVDRDGYHPDHFTVTADQPITWELDVRVRTPCNAQLVFQGREHALVEGKNRITFTADQGGTLPFCCGMGMLRGRIEVRAPGPGDPAEPASAPDPLRPRPTP